MVDLCNRFKYYNYIYFFLKQFSVFYILILEINIHIDCSLFLRHKLYEIKNYKDAFKSYEY
jgi:hypothetical protein